MSTAIAERKPFSIEPITFPIIAEKIGELSREYMPLKVAGLDDSNGLKVVHEARMVVKNLRVNVEKRRKELKASALEYGRNVDSAAKQITDLLTPIEEHLESEENAVAEERERIKREVLQKRLDIICVYDQAANPLAVAAMSEEVFQAECLRLKAAFEERQRVEALEAAERKRLADIEAKRLADEAEARRIEGERLTAERAELDRQRREQEAERAKIDAERRAIELENAKREAAEKSRVETEQRLQRQAAEKQAAEDARIAREKAEADRQEQARTKAEAERPQRERLLAVAAAVDDIDIPEGPGAMAVTRILEESAERIRKVANGPLT